MVLEHDRAGLREIALQAQPGVIHPDLNLVVDQDAIVQDGYSGVLQFFALLEPGRVELDVITLPGARRLAGIDTGCGLPVNRTARLGRAL